MKKKPDITGLILDLTVMMEKKEEEARQHRDEWYEAQGAAGELQVVIWKLEEMVK